LQTDYIDLLLIHQAYGDVFGSWRAMEKAYKAGKVRAIGVSNFQAGRFFDFAHYVEVKPMVNQLQCNTLIQQTGIEAIHAEFGTKMMAWGPLGGQGVDGIVKSETLAAIGEKYNKSAAQVALRWLTQRGIVAIPKSSHKERMAQNFDIFDFTLSDADMAQIAQMNQHDTGTINFSDPQFVKYLIENYG
jgi:diketogulonate reductase-like aldo/keto reductase